MNAAFLLITTAWIAGADQAPQSTAAPATAPASTATPPATGYTAPSAGSYTLTPGTTYGMTPGTTYGLVPGTSSGWGAGSGQIISAPLDGHMGGTSHIISAPSDGHMGSTGGTGGGCDGSGGCSCGEDCGCSSDWGGECCDTCCKMGLCARLKARFHRRSCCATCESDCGCEASGGGSWSGGASCGDGSCGGGSWGGHDSWGSGQAAPHLSGAPGTISSVPLHGGTMGGTMGTGTIITPSTPGTMPSAGEQIKAPKDSGPVDKMPAGNGEDKGKKPREDKGKDDNKEARTEPLPEITPATPAAPAASAPRPADTDVKNSPF